MVKYFAGNHWNHHQILGYGIPIAGDIYLILFNCHLGYISNWVIWNLPKLSFYDENPLELYPMNWDAFPIAGRAGRSQVPWEGNAACCWHTVGSFLGCQRYHIFIPGKIYVLYRFLSMDSKWCVFAHIHFRIWLFAHLHIRKCFINGNLSKWPTCWTCSMVILVKFHHAHLAGDSRHGPGKWHLRLRWKRLHLAPWTTGGTWGFASWMGEWPVIWMWKKFGRSNPEEDRFQQGLTKLTCLLFPWIRTGISALIWMRLNRSWSVLDLGQQIWFLCRDHCGEFVYPGVDMLFGQWWLSTTSDAQESDNSSF